MPDCQHESIKLYDGEHRCMMCYARFMPWVSIPKLVDPQGQPQRWWANHPSMNHGNGHNCKIREER